MRFLVLKRKSILRIFSCCVVLILVVFLAFAGVRLIEKKCVYPLKYKEQICFFADKYSLKREFVFAIVKAESGFDKNAVSKRGAKGLMQLTDATAEYVSKKCQCENYSIFNENDNLNLGCCYLRYLFDKFSDDFTVLASYNAGEGRVAMWLTDERYSKNGKTLIDIPYKETRDYISKIYKSLDKYRKLYGNILDKD